MKKTFPDNSYLFWAIVYASLSLNQTSFFVQMVGSVFLFAMTVRMAIHEFRSLKAEP